MMNELISPLFSLGQSLLVYMLVLSLQLLVIMLLRKPVARHIGAVTAYRLWALPLLLLPFYWINLPTIDWNTLWRLLRIGGESAQGIVSWAPQMLKELDFELTLPALESMTQADGRVYWLWLSVICSWLGMAVLLLLLQIREIRRFSRGLSLLAGGQTCGEVDQPGLSSLPVNYLQGLGSPALFGVFRPRLLLPADFGQRYAADQRALILRHEAVHLQRHDNLWNLLATLLRLLFWFNPILHLAWKRFRLDQELSCDERVLQEANPEKGRQYARMLLESMSTGLEFRHQPTITTWGNLREIRERTHMIRYHINNKPRHRVGKWLLLCCVLSGSLLTAIHNEGFREVVAADESRRPGNTLSREVFERIERVQELQDQIDYDGALEIMGELRAMYDQEELNDYEAYMMFVFYGGISMQQREFESSIGYWQEALQSPNLSAQQQGVAYSSLGYLFNQTGDYQSSIDHFMRYLELVEEPASNAYMTMAIAYFEMKRFDEAIPLAEQALAMDANMSGAYRLLQRAYMETGRDAEAEEMSRLIAEWSEEQAQDDIVPEAVRLSSNEYLPTETVPPRYPGAALREGIEGWVQVSFTVNEQGEVIDPVVVDAEPEGNYFEESSLEAIRRFRFEPREQNGTPVATENVQYVFTYRFTE